MQHAPIDPALQAVLREASGQPDLTVQAATALRDIPGWDSMSMVSAILSIEDRFGIEFQRNEFAALSTVGDLAALVSSALAEASGG